MRGQAQSHGGNMGRVPRLPSSFQRNTDLRFPPRISHPKSNNYTVKMSSSSSETAVHASPARVAYMFLAQFDPKSGYKLVWGSDEQTSDFSGLEYKALPSGVHEFKATSIYLAHEARGKLYYGSARFRQSNLNVEGGSDRSLVKMYSLGILVEPLKGQYWKPHEYSSVGWEHLGALDSALQTYLNSGDLAAISSLYSSLSASDPSVDSLRSLPICNADHPLSKLPTTLSTVGPLVFPLFKAALLRKNILIFNHSSQASAELVQEPSPRGPAACGALAYALSLISVIPKNVQFERLSQSQTDGTRPLYSQPLYTVGLQDMDTRFLTHYHGFIASTSDEILKYQNKIYDVAVVMPSSEHSTCQVFASNDFDTEIRATYNDYNMFLKAYKRLPQSSDCTQLNTGDDQSSIRTSSSIFSALGLGYFTENRTEKLRREPTWWLSDATSPMSWREYIWSAFSWFASAGTTQREAEKISLDADDSPENPDSSKAELLQLTSIVGQFHKLTKKWFFIIGEILGEATGSVPTSPNEKVTLELTPQDLVDMELDPYSAQDIQFVREFVLIHWKGVVDEVEIGLGLHSFLC